VRETHAIAVSRTDSKCAPSTADVKEAMALLEVDFVEDEVDLVVLHVLEGVRLGELDAGGVDHAGTEERGVEVICMDQGCHLGWGGGGGGGILPRS
jgi:hypothetical protein